MTQTQRRQNAYVIAGVTVVLSCVLWTAIITVIVNKYNTLEKGIAWQGIIKELVPDEEVEVSATLLPIAEEKEVAVHKAAPDKEIRDADVHELDQWEIHRAYSLQIPSINIRVPVLLPSVKFWNERKWDLLEEQMQVGLSHGLVAYPHSSNPGKRGSLIIAGHSSPPNERAAESVFGNIFRRLPELKHGDAINVIVNNKPVVYEVQSTAVVPATATTILQQQNDESILKLITCFPIGTTKDRLVVTAKKV